MNFCRKSRELQLMTDAKVKTVIFLCGLATCSFHERASAGCDSVRRFSRNNEPFNRFYRRRMFQRIHGSLENYELMLRIRINQTLKALILRSARGGGAKSRQRAAGTRAAELHLHVSPETDDQKTPQRQHVRIQASVLLLRLNPELQLQRLCGAPTSVSG